MKLNPYLSFNGNCEEALDFYKQCLGGEFEAVSRFDEAPPEMQVPAESKDKILHMSWRFNDNLVMAGDSLEDVPTGGMVTLAIDMNDPEEMENTFNELSREGNVTMPLQDTFWGARFGMFTDKFGLNWMFNCQVTQ